MNNSHSEHYDADYFEWRRKIGKFGGQANSYKFEDSIKETQTVLDFGCGGGFLLSQLNCQRRIGIEPNTSAHAQSVSNGVEVFESPQSALGKLGEESIDVIISNNALDHTLHPLSEIQSLYHLLKRGGIIHFVVPCDSVNYQWKPNDVNYHLYSWSPMNLGNIFSEAGFKIVRVKPYIHKWPPKYQLVQKIFGWRLFNLACRIYGRIERSWYQVELSGTKE